MHDIEPHYKWRDKYVSSDDERTPFHGREYDEFSFSQKIYNYFIHPQWDAFGSATLYTKLLYAEYGRGFAIFEMMGEWNDCLNNDIMFFKREVVDCLIPHGIHKFIIICENVLNFHGEEDDYYEEWVQDIAEDGGWICFVNTLNHVEEEMQESQIHFHGSFGHPFNQLNWRTRTPVQLCQQIEALMQREVKQLRY